MSIQELTLAEIESLVGTRNPVTGIEYPENGMQPYYEWLVRTLDLLSGAAASGAALKVNRDDSGPTAVIIVPGAAVLGGVSVGFAGGTLDLAFYNNDVAHLWLYDDGGSAALGVAGSVGGWPATPHVKLAEVTLSAGAITAIVDRRTDLMLTDLNPAAITGTAAAGFLVNNESDQAKIQLDTHDATGDFILALSPANLTADRRWTFPDATDVVVGIAATQTLTNKTLTAATINGGAISGAGITGLPSPSASSDAATKGYVDSVAQGLDIKPSVRVATTEEIELSGLQTIDGVDVQAGDRVLVKDQSEASENGIYVVASGAWSRAADANTDGKVTAGLAAFVTEGGAWADTMWVLVTDDPVTLGTTALTFTRFGAGGIAAVVDDPAPALGGNLVVGFNSFTSSDGTPLISFSDDTFGNHHAVFAQDVVATGRSFLDDESNAYLTFDPLGGPAGPITITSHDGNPVLSASGVLYLSGGSGVVVDPGGGFTVNPTSVFLGDIYLHESLPPIVVYAQDVQFRDNTDNQNTFLVFNSPDLSLYLGATTGPVAITGNAFGIFGVTPAERQPGGVETPSLTDDSGGTADGGGVVAAIGAGTLDGSAASQADVQNALATIISLVNQLTTQTNKHRDLLLAFGWGFDETP